MTLPVFVDPNLASRQRCCGSEIVLTGAEAHHAVAVRRMMPGERIELVDGRGLRVCVEVTATAKNELRGNVCAVTSEPQPAVAITLVQALAKGGRDEQAIETATEFGVQQVIPWEAKRCIASWAQGAKAEKARGKWAATVQAAAKQSRRAWIPSVAEKLSSSQLAKWIAAQTDSGGVVFVCHEEGTVHLTAQLAEITAQTTAAKQNHTPKQTLPKSISFIVGPEGGISAAELADFKAAGARIVLLGEHVLRAATAGPWAIAVTKAWLDSPENRVLAAKEAELTDSVG